MSLELELAMQEQESKQILENLAILNEAVIEFQINNLRDTKDHYEITSRGLNHKFAKFRSFPL